jgi:hypothetical protein
VEFEIKGWKIPTNFLKSLIAILSHMESNSFVKVSFEVNVEEDRRLIDEQYASISILESDHYGRHYGRRNEYESSGEEHEELESNEVSTDEESNEGESSREVDESDQESQKRKRKKQTRPIKKKKLTSVSKNKLGRLFSLDFEFNQKNPKPILPCVPSILEWTRDEHIKLIKSSVGLRLSLSSGFQTGDLSKTLTRLEFLRKEEFSENMEEFKYQSSEKTYDGRIGHLFNEIQGIGTGHYNTLAGVYATELEFESISLSGSYVSRVLEATGDYFQDIFGKHDVNEEKYCQFVINFFYNTHQAYMTPISDPVILNESPKELAHRLFKMMCRSFIYYQFKKHQSPSHYLEISLDRLPSLELNGFDLKVLKEHVLCDQLYKDIFK